MCVSDDVSTFARETVLVYDCCAADRELHQQMERTGDEVALEYYCRFFGEGLEVYSPYFLEVEQKFPTFLDKFHKLELRQSDIHTEHFTFD